jgi:hypothetical protein
MVRQTERDARASWQPARLSAGEVDDSTSAVESVLSPPADELRARTVDHPAVEDQAGPIPEEFSGIQSSAAPLSPPKNRSNLLTRCRDSLLSGVSRGTSCDANCDDGCDALGCDSIPPSSCACGNTSCDGSCAAVATSCGSCDGRGCNACGEHFSPEAWGPNVTIPLPQDGWVSLEFLGWRTDGLGLPPLVTTSTNPSISRPQAGVLTDPTTQILFGGNEVLTDEFEGGRLKFGVWLDRAHTWGFGAELFEIGTESVAFGATSDGNPILARPFFNTETGVEDAGIVAYPSVASGRVAAAAASRFRGAAINFRRLRSCDEGCSKLLFFGQSGDFCSRTEAIFGLRFLELEEAVAIEENMLSTDVTTPGSLAISDRFDTRNRFDGIDLGWSYRRVRGFWSVDTMLRLAIGNTRQTVTIRGRTTVNDPTNTPPVQTLPGGLLTQTSNIGTFQQDEFAVVPEFNLNLAYQLTSRFKISLGYTAIYWSNVVRPGDHMSRDINPNLFPPPPASFSGTQRPAFAFDPTDYWAQGINFGGEYRW